MRDLTAVVIHRHVRFFKVMSTFISPARAKIVYPDSDGQPTHVGQYFAVQEENARLAEEQTQRAEEQAQRADRLAARLRELGVEPD
jgi:hypothetical protein